MLLFKHHANFFIRSHSAEMLLLEFQALLSFITALTPAVRETMILASKPFVSLGR